MISQSNFDLVSLDFDAYKASLKNYLRSQALFKDFDFDGANINVLLDILSYNSFKNAFFTNMALSEGFLDSAQLLNSVRSHAKELNYTPRSTTSAKANITVNFTAAGTNQPYIIQKGRSFSSVVKNGSFIFSVPETLTVSSATNNFSFTTDVYEGIYVKDSYVFVLDDSEPQPKFALTNVDIDTSSLVVTVFEDGSVVGDTYKFTTSLLGITETTKAFFLQTSEITGNYEIMFGDGVLGRRPKLGATVVFDYRVSNGAGGNGASAFNINFDPTGSFQEMTSSVTIVTNQNALGGAAIEDIETTRFNAPRYFQVQERGCIASDYEILLQQAFPEIAAINAYGGEELIPPQFGKVVIALAIANVTGLPTSKIDQYITFLKTRSMLTITPIFILPDFTYIQVDSTIRYNINISSESVNRVQTIVSAVIADFNTTFLNDFNVTLRFSQLTTAIDQADSAIVSNLTKIQLYKKVFPLLNLPNNYILNYGVPLISDLTPLAASHASIQEKVLSSTSFRYRGVMAWLEDDNNGVVRIVNLASGSYTTMQNIGTINYATGQIVISNFTPDSFDGSSLDIFVRVADNDVACVKNTIMLIESPGIVLTIEQLQI